MSDAVDENEMASNAKRMYQVDEDYVCASAETEYNRARTGDIAEKASGERNKARPTKSSQFKFTSSKVQNKQNRSHRALGATRRVLVILPR